MGFLRFESGVQEIFAVKVLPNTRYPEILEWDDPQMAFSYVLPDKAQQELRKGDTERGKGNFANAISRYKEAWKQAQRASGNNPIVAATLDPTDVDDEREVGDEPTDAEAQSFQLFLPRISR